MGRLNVYFKKMDSFFARNGIVCCLMCAVCAFADLDNPQINFTDVEDEVENVGPLVTRVPRAFVCMGPLVEEGEWGKEINVDEIQGITADSKHYYITNQWEIYKVAKDNPQKVVAKRHLMGIQRFLKDGFYRHFGGISYYKGFVYVATTGRVHPLTTKRAVPIVVVFDTDLNFVKFARFPENSQAGAAWIAVNPTNGHLYSSYNKTVFEYSSSFLNGGELSLLSSYRMDFEHADLSQEEWDDAVAQGGTFTNEGVLFYVLDLKHAEFNTSTGIHAFVLHGGRASEIDVFGLNNKGELRPFISVRYRGSMDGDRFWEMEDVQFGVDSVGEYIDLLKLRNGKKDEAEIVRYRLIHDLKAALNKLVENLF